MAHSGLQVAITALTLAALSLFGGCGDDDSSGPDGDTAAPTIVAASPSDGASDVTPYPIVEVQFSEAMDPATIDTLSVQIEGVRSYLVSYDSTEHTVTLYPATVLEAATEYAILVEASVTDLAGNALEQAATIDFTTGVRDCDHLADRFEPNDVLASATHLELDTPYIGLTACGGAERIDFYSFTLTEKKKVLARSDDIYADTSISWKIHFRRGDGEYYCTQGTSIGPTEDPTDFYYTFFPGTYYVETGKDYADSHFVIYHLTLETSDPALDDAYEDNDFGDEATPITPGRHEGLRAAYLDADVFAIDLAAGQTLTVTMTEVTDKQGLRRLNIQNIDGGNYTGHTDSADPAVESWTAATTGTYYISIIWWTDDVIYDLDVEVAD